MQGFRPAGIQLNDGGLGIIKHAFPNSVFPLAAIHEFYCNTSEESSSSAGFISGVLSSLVKKGGAAVWISSSQKIFPPALKIFGLRPEQVIFIYLKNEKEKIWAMEEVLKCDSISSVVGEINEISFTQSRRLQLAVEQSKVTGFVIRKNPKNHATACVTRWKIRPVESDRSGLPGVGFPKWAVQLLKVRNGKPGAWQITWKEKKFRLFSPPDISIYEEQRLIV